MVAWWENDGDMVFDRHVITDEFSDPYSVFASDLDSDGDTDVLSASYNDSQVAWWENDGDQEFTIHLIDTTFSGAACVYTTDVDGDDDIDVLGAGETGGGLIT